jgi:hypothetical protein
MDASAAKTMTSGSPWNGNRSSCSRFDSSVFSSEVRMYSKDGASEYEQKQPESEPEVLSAGQCQLHCAQFEAEPL